MAQVLPAKRPRGLTGHHRSSLNGIAGPSRHKRPRQSVEPSERSYTEEADEEASNAPEDDEIDDDTYLRQTQRIVKEISKNANTRNMPADAGIIEEIKCTNFMCHDQLTVTLGPLINFIIGHNGSGKSAVLTALTVCLGGKASATNRGQNLKAFIKEGREFANLAVKIKNQGDLAYKPDQYGDSIIVERHFTRHGSSGFKLKDRNGRIVSQKKTDVEDVIDAFALQIDNPMNVLTQDMARQFLNHSTPKDKYKFFLKGTQLESLDNDYRQIGLELEEQEARAQTLEGDVDILRKKFEKDVANAKRAEKLEIWRQKETLLAHQAAWAQVESEERALALQMAEVERLTGLIASRQEAADLQSEEYGQADDSLENAKKKLGASEAKLQPTLDEYEKKGEEFRGIKKRLLQYNVDERKLMGSIKAHEDTVKASQAELSSHREMQKEADDGRHAQKVQEYENMRSVHQQRKEEHDHHVESLSELTKERDRLHKIQSDFNTQIRGKESEVKSSMARVQSLERDTGRWIDSYQNPRGLEDVLRAIQSETTFRERPVGPMGRHVELLRSEWGSILEKSFGQVLEGFVVTSKDDQVTLKRILTRFKYNAPIFIGSKAPISTNGHEPDSEHLTWMRALKINNDLVRNQLIINQNIEQVVLIQSRDAGWKFITATPQPRNTKFVLTHSDESRRKGHQITPGGNISPVQEFQGRFRMQADKGPQIQGEKDNLQQLKRELQALKGEARMAQDQLTAAQAEVVDHGNKRKRLKELVKQAARDEFLLEQEVNVSIPDATTGQVLENALEDAQKSLDTDLEQFGDLTKVKDQLHRDARAAKDRVDKLRETVDEHNRQIEVLKEGIQTLTEIRDRALRAKNKAIDEVAQAEANKAEWEVAIPGLQDAVDRQTQDASVIAPRVPVPEGGTFESLNHKLEQLKGKRQEMEKQLGGSQADLLRIANAARKAYEDAANEIRSTAQVRRALKMALKTRQDRWLEFRKQITLRARSVFSHLLSERRFRGNLLVDHRGQKLDISVQPDITVQEAEGRQTKTLSGGEKSFSTICLLLALWDAMGSPIRCLDEFDVFMDQVNRDISMTMIIGAARRAIGRQYILITPQSMNNKKIHSMDDVKIIRMGDPERGQTALNFRA